MRIILASSSPARQRLLQQVGVSFDVVVPDMDEELARQYPPVVQARILAEWKAHKVSQQHPDAVVIGADQVLDLDGQGLGKPADAADARRLLDRLAGRTHTLVTALCVIAPGRSTWVDHTETELTVRTLDAAEKDAYVSSGEWEGCAGGYRIEGRGLALFESMSGGDHSSIQGLPVPMLLTYLRSLGWRLSSWTRPIGV